MAPLASVVFFGVFVGALTVAVYGAGRFAQHYRRDRYDATTTGVVVANEPPDPARSPQADGGLPHLAYEYAVEDETHQTDRIRATAGPLSPYGLETLLGDPAVGDEVTVHYDSEDPSAAVLITPESGRGWAVLAVTALLVAVLSLVPIL